MTPKEKAKELIKKFIEPTKVPNVKGFWVEDLDGAKQCALIAVEEIILTTFKKQTWDKWKIIPQKESLTEYWQKVKNEIEKL